MERRIDWRETDDIKMERLGATAMEYAPVTSATAQ